MSTIRAVPEPSVYHITAEDWRVDEKRDAFEARFLDILGGLRVGSGRLAWSDRIEALLWGVDSGPAWFRDKAAWNQFYSKRVAKQLRPLLDSVPTDDTEGLAEIAPDPTGRPDEEPYKEEFLRICASYCLLDEDFVLALGFDAERPTSVLVRQPGCADRQVQTVSEYDDILALVEVTDDLWPQSADDGETLRRALGIWHRRHAFSADGFIYEFSFAGDFLRALSKERDDRAGVLDSMVRRLTQTRRAAEGDRAIQDEDASWAGQTVRRFRARGPRRIHYECPSARAIRFIDYYPEGKHDVGLRAKD